MFLEIFRKKKKEPDHSFKLIYEMFYSHVYKTAFFITKDHHSAQDIVQETFIKVFNNLDKVEDGSKMRAWISTITTRTAIDFIRKQRKGNEFETEDVDTLNLNGSEHVSTVEEEVEKSIESERIRAEIQKLSPEYRSVLYFKYIEDLKDQEIANVLGLNVGTIKTRIHRAKNQLKKKLHTKSFMDGEL